MTLICLGPLSLFLKKLQVSCHLQAFQNPCAFWLDQELNPLDDEASGRFDLQEEKVENTFYFNRTEKLLASIESLA